MSEVFRCLRRLSRNGCGYDAIRWASESPRRSLNGFAFFDQPFTIPPRNRKYYDDGLWDDRLPEYPTLRTVGRPYDVEAFRSGEF